jgi:hypothetical protein
LEVRRKVKSSAVQQVGCTEGQVGP